MASTPGSSGGSHLVTGRRFPRAGGVPSPDVRSAARREDPERAPCLVSAAGRVQGLGQVDPQERLSGVEGRRRAERLDRLLVSLQLVEHPTVTVQIGSVSRIEFARPPGPGQRLGQIDPLLRTEVAGLVHGRRVPGVGFQEEAVPGDRLPHTPRPLLQAGEAEKNLPVTGALLCHPHHVVAGLVDLSLIHQDQSMEEPGVAVFGIDPQDLLQLDERAVRAVESGKGEGPEPMPTLLVGRGGDHPGGDPERRLEAVGAVVGPPQPCVGVLERGIVPPRLFQERDRVAQPILTKPDDSELHRHARVPGIVGVQALQQWDGFLLPTQQDQRAGTLPAQIIAVGRQRKGAQTDRGGRVGGAHATAGRNERIRGAGEIGRHAQYGEKVVRGLFGPPRPRSQHPSVQIEERAVGRRPPRSGESRSRASALRPRAS